MPTFEVYIPAVSDADMNVTLTVDEGPCIGPAFGCRMSESIRFDW